MHTVPRLSRPLLGAACLFAGLCGCGRQSAISTAVPAAPAAQANKETQTGEGKQAGPAPGQPAAAAPGDKGSKRVAKLLEPSDAGLAAEARRARGPRDFPAAPGLESPQPPLPAYTGELPRLPSPPGGTVILPGPLPEGAPLARYRAAPRLPGIPELPAGGLVRLPAPDLNRPVPLPTLASPVSDRAPLTDPTPEISLAAVLAEPVPVRITPAPFAPRNLPDPFEHAQAARLRAPPAEDPLPPLVFPRPPGK
jgi:hypothetical protein